MHRRSTFVLGKKRRCKLKHEEERLFEHGYLKAKCKELRLEEEYRHYQMRLMISYLGVFFILQTVITAVHSIVLLTLSENSSLIYIDVMFTLIPASAVLMCLSINFHEKLVTRHRWVMVVTSILATFIAVFGDIGQCLFAKFANGWVLNNTYDTYNLCMIYMFLPITSTMVAITLGSIVSVMYVVYYITASIRPIFDSSESIMPTVDIIHYLCFNMLGIFFRMMNDTLVRSSFLDRHQFIMEEIWLKNARLQETMLLNSILPPQIAKSIQMNIKDKIVKTETGLIYNKFSHKSIMAIQQHFDVSILYADVVNYTHLTTTLTVEKLVKALHELYGRFDMAASLFKVQRIKFLGDCYYCVAGLTEPDPDHAKCAVSLGISMIANIQEVRKERNLNIDMRIGVHSGNLLAGVIGDAKLQLDIWGADVIIASHLESTGVPGYVHVSGRTLANLNEREYTVTPGTEQAKLDPILQKHPMNTYLITGVPRRESVRPTMDARELGSIFEYTARPSVYYPYGGDGVPKSVTEEVAEQFRKMPVGGFERRRDPNTRSEKTGIGWFCAAFKDSRLEWDYLRRPDFILKYSLLMAWLIGCCLVFIQVATRGTDCPYCILVDSLAFIILTILTCIACCRVFKIFESLQYNMWNRIVVYLSIILIYYIVVTTIALNCDTDRYQLNYIESKLFSYEADVEVCFHPWAFTNMMALILGMSYTFTRIPFSLKTSIGLLEVISIALVMCFQFDFIFNHSVTTNPYLPALAAHIMRMGVTLVTFYVKERHVEFNTKTNFKLNVDLKKKQESADITNQSIIILLNNILPSHVVDVYLTTSAKNELYYETYEMVSVMFAMLINFQMDLQSLRVLNDIITEFDKLLGTYREYFVVEKIKVVGCTYMAACGLDFNMASRIQKTSGPVSDLTLVEADWLQSSLRRMSNRSNDDDGHEEVVFVMTSFALDLMRTLSECNKAYAEVPFDRALSSGEICIGISSGKIMAGVVGASQPHYDIWGNAVNLASRMQSTGVAGTIQMTQESAQILESFDVKTTYRGMTYVKGVGEIPTYFVDIDDFQFVLGEDSGFYRKSTRRYSMVTAQYSTTEESETSEEP